MTEDEYSFYYDKNGLVVHDKHMDIMFGERDNMYAKIIDITYNKEDKSILIELDNGKEINIYWNIPNKKIVIETD
jgi:hypothetical protein